MKALLIFLLFLAIQTNGQNIDRNGLALEGYDPVSYFSGKPQEGNAKFSARHEGATYYFTSQANKDAFLKAPQQYAPLYGGWCAYAMGEKGEKVEVDPETYKILDGHLLLFYNAFFTNTLTYWNKDEARLKKQADINWKKQ